MLSEWQQLHLFNSTRGDYRFFDAKGIELDDFSIYVTFTALLRVLPRDANLDQNRSLESVPVSSGYKQGLPADKNFKQSDTLLDAQDYYRL